MTFPLGGLSQKSCKPMVEPFQQLCKMVGYDRIPNAEELSSIIGMTGNAQLFEQNVDSFLKATGMTIEDVTLELRQIEGRLGLLSPLPLMSLKEGIVDPTSFSGVAILTTGTANYIEFRIQELVKYIQAGAQFDYVLCLGGNRPLTGVADMKHPLAKEWSDLLGGGTLVEASFQRLLVQSYLDKRANVLYVDPPASEKSLNLQQLMQNMLNQNWYAELLVGESVYLPVNFNATFVALQAQRLLGVGDIYTSQNGGTLADALPTYWAPVLQHVLTWPNGAFRLLKELVGAGLIQAG